MHECISTELDIQDFNSTVRPRCEKSNQVLPGQTKFGSRGCRRSPDLDTFRPGSGLSMGDMLTLHPASDKLLGWKRFHPRFVGRIRDHFRLRLDQKTGVPEEIPE
jgi:hypothetical protein